MLTVTEVWKLKDGGDNDMYIWRYSVAVELRDPGQERVLCIEKGMIGVNSLNLTLPVICVSAETMEDDPTQQGSLPLRLGVSAHNVQLMKASFFAEETEGDKGMSETQSLAVH